MNHLIARLINCGIPRETAVWICRYFSRNATIRAFERYVEDVEDECRECVDAV